MKMTASINIRNGTFNQIKNHINRTFENRTNQDKNIKHINYKFSPFNLSNLGSYKIRNNKLVFIYDKNKTRSNRQNLSNIINSQYSNYIENHNNKKSVKHNPKRKIKNLFQEKLLKELPKNQRSNDRRNYLDKFSRLFIQNCGNSQENLKKINLIKRKNKISFTKANFKYREAVSIALANYAQNFHKFNKHLLITNYSTNIDECANKKKMTPDALHVHTSMLGLTQTKTGKPSFSFGRALCDNEHIKYTKTMKVINHKRVNASVNRALKKFRKRNGKIFLKQFLQPVLSKQFPKVKQFKNINYKQTGQRINGISMNKERLRMSAKTLEKQFHKKLKGKQKRQATINRRNGARRSRNKKKYKAQLKYLDKRNKAIKQAHKRILNERKVDNQKYIKNVIQRQKLSNKIELQHKTIKKNKIRINHQKSNLDKISNLIKSKESKLKSVANNIVNAIKETLKQNNNANNYNVKAIKSANSRLIRNKAKQAQTGIFGHLKNTFNQFTSNYSVSASQSNFNSFSNVYNSVSSASAYKSALPKIRASKQAQSQSLAKYYKLLSSSNYQKSLSASAEDSRYYSNLSRARERINSDIKPNRNEKGWQR